MLLVIIALLWVALLAPMAVRRLRDSKTERSIESFHTEHEVLARQGYAVPPAHRLSDPEAPGRAPEPRASRLTVVHDDDTYGSLESRRSWEEWSEDYDYERHEAPARVSPANRYASAYASVPRDVAVDARYEAPLRRRTMRAQRRMIVTRLGIAVVATTSLALALNSSILVDLAVLTWVALAAYVALALYAVSQGLLDESSLWVSRARGRDLATVEPLYDEEDEQDDGTGYGRRVRALNAEDWRDDAYSEPSSEGWQRQSSRFALG
ncbi:MAG: hypothetical protein KGJ36_07335 [Acidobacteriota bacterium]|nr:hypothetical protein [Acidobacteriota bacterium]